MEKAPGAFLPAFPSSRHRYCDPRIKTGTALYKTQIASKLPNIEFCRQTEIKQFRSVAELGEGDEPVHGSSIIAAIMPALGAASIGAVVALIVADRIIRERPAEIQTRLRFGAWAFALAAGVTVEAAYLAGPGVLPWLAFGAAMSGMTRVTMARVR